MNTIFKQNYSLNLFIAFRLAYFCCFSFGGNLDFLQKSFITSTTGTDKNWQIYLNRV